MKCFFLYFRLALDSVDYLPCHISLIVHIIPFVCFCVQCFEYLKQRQPSTYMNTYKYFPPVFSRSHLSLWWICRSPIHFKLRDLFFSFVYVHLVAQYYLKILPFLPCIFSALLSKFTWLCVYGFIPGFPYSVLIICQFVFQFDGFLIAIDLESWNR